jgi:hypothetical protein
MVASFGGTGVQNLFYPPVYADGGKVRSPQAYCSAEI